MLVWVVVAVVLEVSVSTEVVVIVTVEESVSTSVVVATAVKVVQAVAVS